MIVNISGDPKSFHVPATTVRIIQGIHDATVWLPVSWACLVEAQAWKQDSKHSKRDATNHHEVSDCDIRRFSACLSHWPLHGLTSSRDIRDISPWLVSKHQTVQTTRHIPTARNQCCHAPSVGKSRRNLGCLGQWHLRMSLCGADCVIIFRCLSLTLHLYLLSVSIFFDQAICFFQGKAGKVLLARDGKRRSKK